MKNRIPGYLSDSRRTDRPSEPAFQEFRDPARKQFSDQIRLAGIYVREHPLTGLSTAFCIGIFLGWVIKRK